MQRFSRSGGFAAFASFAVTGVLAVAELTTTSAWAAAPKRVGAAPAAVVKGVAKNGNKTAGHAAGKPGTPGSKAGPTSSKAAPASKATTAAEKQPPAVLHGKVAVFSFAGEGAAPLRREVVRVLQSKGLRIISNIRAVDSPDQYRAMAEVLKVFAYVDGDMEVDGADASATVQIRSAATGLKVASTTFAGEKKKVLADLGKGLWEEVAPGLSQASADALLPRKHEAPMRIEAGTPIENTDAEPLGGGPVAAGGKPGAS